MTGKTMRGALLLLGAAASAQTTYRDPSGRFTVQVPAGWQAAQAPDRPDTATISRGKASVNLSVGATQDTSPKDALSSYERGISQNCPGFQGLERSAFTMAGLPTASLKFSCADPREGQVTMSVAMATRSGELVFFFAQAPSSQYDASKRDFDAIRDSLRLSSGGAAPSAAAKSAGNPQQLAALQKACAAGVFTADECAAKRAALAGGGNPGGNPQQLAALQKACAAGVFTADECAAKRAALSGGGNPAAPAPSNAPQPGGGSQVYRDPRGRFSVAVPPGWTATPQGQGGGDGVQISQGSSWAVLSPFGGAARPDEVINQLAGQFQSQYRNLRIVSHAPFQLGAHDAAFTMYSGTNPKGVEVSLVISGVHASGNNYLAMISSVPAAQAEAINQVFRDISLSIRFAGE
ncbi:exported hypothetical protein [Candidatus Sulfopaludibacter sp. SbA4]|nr:exported hypothetical protein [Candidatus Sulfopaludibacter sp. SbA4]